MRRRDATTTLVLLAVGLLAVDVNLYSAAVEDRAPRGDIFLSEMRLDTLKLRIERRIEPTHAAWLDLQSRADGLLDRRPHPPEHWYVPGYYREAFKGELRK